MLQFLESKLYSDVEGTCSGQFGYIIAVVSILDIGKGMVLSGSGQAEFITRYRAIVFKPFKGEVVDGVVNNVNKVRPQAVQFWMYLTLVRGLDGFLCGSGTFDDICVATGGGCHLVVPFDHCLNDYV
jgi:DNA-directed RNA polymerase subunit E'/Rpb7